MFSLNSSNRIQQLQQNANIAGPQTKKKQLSHQQKAALSNLSSFTNNGQVANFQQIPPNSGLLPSQLTHAQQLQQQKFLDSNSSQYPHESS